jgi:hypothetical protein
MDSFVIVNAGTLSPAQFFDPAYVSVLVGGAG